MFKLIKRKILVLITIIYLISFAGLLFAQDIVFVLPKSLKVSTNTITVKGVIMDFDVKEVEITLVNLIDLVKEQEKVDIKKRQKTKEPESWLNTLEYEKIPVINSFFQKTFRIKTGINAILAKPAGEKASPDNTEMKVVVLDKTSSKIELYEPKTNRIAELKQISGKIIKKPYPENIKITIETLISFDTNGDKTYKMNELLEVTVPVKRKRFKFSVNIREFLTGDEIMIITISDNGEQITHTLF